MAENKKLKVCKTCGAEIAKNAKVCPHCGAKQKKHVFLLIIGVIFVLCIIGAALSGDESSNTSSSSTKGSISSNSSEAVSSVVEITYSDYSMTELTEDLENNAAAANEKYLDQYVSITGRLSVIDAQGDYISIEDPKDEYTFTSCRCDYDNDEEISKIVKTLKKDDIITVKGKITDVGEVFGYSMDIDSIETE